MLFRRLARGLLVGLICLGLILSPGIASAAGLEMPPGASFAAPPPVVCDVRLDSSGRLWGMLVDVQGVPLARAEVALVRPNVDLSTAVTDTLGRFSLGRRRGEVDPRVERPDRSAGRAANGFGSRPRRGGPRANAGPAVLCLRHRGAHRHGGGHGRPANRHPLLKPKRSEPGKPMNRCLTGNGLLRGTFSHVAKMVH